jgi:hypothetical protein
MNLHEDHGVSRADERTVALRDTRIDTASSMGALPELRPTVYCPSPVVARCLDAGRD